MRRQWLGHAQRAYAIEQIPEAELGRGFIHSGLKARLDPLHHFAPGAETEHR
jgi:hypothetical protein